MSLLGFARLNPTPEMFVEIPANVLKKTKQGGLQAFG
jgi:hypothetical protein